MTRPDVLPGYESLAAVLDDALEHAQSGKGKERHASGEPFDLQPIVAFNLEVGTNHGAIFQAKKKATESTRLPMRAARHELLGAINYLAAAVLVLERQAVETAEATHDPGLSRSGDL